MRPLCIFALFVCAAMIPVTAVAQESDTQRTQEIVASFSKEKHEVKEKNGIKREKYKKVVSEPAIKKNIADYSGVYEVSEMGYSINIQAANDGTVKAFGTEPANGNSGQSRNFRLESAKISGALLTGTKVYGDGQTEKFEGVFINRTDYNSPTDAGTRSFGLGVLCKAIEFNGNTFDKLFYQLK